MGLDEILSSAAYKDALARISHWKTRLSGGKGDEAMRVREEKSAFFKTMAKSDPGLYEIFRVDDKTLSEAIYRKMTGKGITID